MPESGTFGSVRGVPGNVHSYRDHSLTSLPSRKTLPAGVNFAFFEGAGRDSAGERGLPPWPAQPARSETNDEQLPTASPCCGAAPVGQRQKGHPNH